MTLLTTILYGLFVGFICFLFGYLRGKKTFYNWGYKDGCCDTMNNYHIDQFLEQLDEVFEEDKDIIDGGEY